MKALGLVALLIASGSAQAKSWCAAPLVVHEWGVQVFQGPEAEPRPVVLPAWFHRDPTASRPEAAPVRSLPADGGERDLPVLHFYTPRTWGDGIPVAVEAGFVKGRAAAWYPDADRVLPPSPGGGASVALAWDALTLTDRARSAPHANTLSWVDDLRTLDGALWVNRGEQSERFLFYEAQPWEQPSVRLEGTVVHNQGAFPAHDLLVVRRHDGLAEVARLDSLGSGEQLSLDFETMDDPGASLRPWLTERLQAHHSLEELGAWSMDMDDCVMQRDPAVAVALSDGHGLFPGEIDALLDLWQGRFFDQDGTVLLYRDDPGALDAMAPLALYTDMRHYVELSRTGLVLWEGIASE